jgi:predicted aconitase with swiveling domain
LDVRPNLRDGVLQRLLGRVGAELRGRELLLNRGSGSTRGPYIDCS